MTHDQEDDTRRPPDFDVSVAHPARVYDYWLGGKGNFPADRDAGELMRAVPPGVVPLKQWRPVQADSGPPTPAYCSIGRKIMQE